VADMITRPAAALTLLARFQPLDPGDLVLTGTLAVPPCRRRRRWWRRRGTCCRRRSSGGSFFFREERNRAYLKAGNVITASIATHDGALDLGTQRTRVRDGERW
jgi:2-keto-4-pentenoate hydratase/2-oxohepta-3-ene-1,7-dioic acid hydratase in catechol pathway